MTHAKTKLARMLCGALLGVTSAIAIGPNGAAAYAQATVGDQGVESSEAILSTSTLFAIGAREAEQQLRGSFGWPTFQEGFVDGVYFRFDPDGYARFSTSPRLDENVFEVQCVAGSTACRASKSTLEIGLTQQGQVQIKLTGITPQDSFFISDRTSELPLPPTVLEPLDPRLETLLSSGGQLIVKREVEVLQTIDLAGFSAVSTYLRWVAQGQNPRVFPRGWPVPAQSAQQLNAGLTQPIDWANVNSGPQRAITTFGAAQSRLAQAGQAVVQVQPGFQQSPQSSLNTGNVAGVTYQQGQQVGQLQAQVQQLQAQISALQTPQSDAEQPLDAGQGFAQQAQARNLVAPTVFPEQGQNVLRPSDFGPQPGGVGQQVTPFPQTGFSQSPFVQQQRQTLFQSPSQDIQNLIARVDQLEYEMRHMRRTVNSAIEKSHDNSDNSSVGVIRSPSPETQLGQLEKLEKLLLDRLGQQPMEAPALSNQSTRSNLENVAPPTNTVSLDRQLVEQLLQQLDSREAAPAPETDLRQMLQQQVNNLDREPTSVQPALRPGTLSNTSTQGLGNAAAAAEAGSETNGGFITLSDYINKVLKEEGVSQ